MLTPDTFTRRIHTGRSTSSSTMKDLHSTLRSCVWYCDNVAMFNSIVKTKRTSSEVIHVPSYSYSVRVIAPPSTVDESSAGLHIVRVVASLNLTYNCLIIIPV